ncbi:MAG TPA: putative Ig domain-containing protein, partial [Chitinophagaceae bacterium]
MKTIASLLLLNVLLCVQLNAQSLPVASGWKFHTGDNPQWASSSFDDGSWKTIAVGHPWEEEGYSGYDGFGWYRIHVRIPSSLKTSSYLKGGLKIDLGKIDDGDQSFLNGKLIGQNAGKGGKIEEGPYNIERVYRLPLNDPAIKWDGDNVIAVRVFDHGGNGGMWEGNYAISVADITDFVQIDDQQSGFDFPAVNHLKKKILLKSTSSRYDFKGELTVKVVDPFTQKTVWEKSLPASFSQQHPFTYTYTAALPESKSYLAEYSFKESRTRKTVKATEGIPYILTPKPSPKPRINGAAIAGVRPGHPFLFRVAATGLRPMQFAAASLPAGFHLDKNTGIITGKSDKEGDYTITLTATNKLGKATRDLKIVVGSQIALTPAMGWNSWNCWGLSVSDAKVRASAEMMIKKGLVNHGWNYINIDDGWEKGRDAAGKIVTNEKFPDMKALGNYIHGLGLKLGIYSSPGTKTCGGFTGSYQHEQQDADSYAKWGIDYLKYDWCSYGQIYPHPTLDEMKKPYQVMRAALNKENRDIYFSFCQYGMGDVWKWGGETGGNSWRTTGDINDSWSSMSGIGFHQYVCAPYAKPGNWNDPDMLVVGKVGWGPSLHNTRLTPDEQYTHISLWCLLSAPLLIGC